jgi:hypothetical protein
MTNKLEKFRKAAYRLAHKKPQCWAEERPFANYYIDILDNGSLKFSRVEVDEDNNISHEDNIVIPYEIVPSMFNYLNDLIGE